MAGLIKILQRILGRVAALQSSYLWIAVGIVLIFTLLVGSGISQITLQSDLSELDPQDIPVTQLRNSISTEFSEFESVVILIEIDDEIQTSDPIEDIRDPRVMRYLLELDGKLSEEPTIQSVQSIGSVFSQFGVPNDIEIIKTIFDAIPQTNEAFDRGYEWTVIFIEADVGGDDAKIKALNERIDEILASSTKPGGIRVTTTGDAPLNSAIFTLLIQDAFFTLIFSTIAIFLLVVILERSVKRALIILFPLLLGLVWTAGTMGWLDIPITVATAAMGAMLLGLGVEYSIFLFSRYSEERRKHKTDRALHESLVNVGSTLVSSGTTTLMGFLALSLSLFPVLSDLGLTLAIGIFFMLAATILAGPLVILIEDRIELRLKGEKEIRHELEVEERESKRLGISKAYNRYGKFVANHPLVAVIIALIITGIMFVGIGMINTQDVDFETILPEDLEEINAFIQITDEFGDSSSALVYVSIDPDVPGSDEPIDIRDPRVLEYIDLLSANLYYIDEVESVSSVVDLVKADNDGAIPKTISTERETFESFGARSFINNDYSGTLVRVSLSEDALDEGEEIIRQLKEVVNSVEKPAGVSAQLSGGLVVMTELNALNGPDSQRTSLIAFAGIIVFLYILTRSVKSTVLPLFTVILGIIWTLGLTGFFQVPFNNISSSVITMTIGIGIDFGLQVVNRFNQELETNKKKKAMENTLTSILTPMIITTVAALIGFRAMGLGELKIMGDLGILMSFGIGASMLAAITGVAGLAVLLQKEGGSRVTKNLKASKRGKNND